MQFEEKMRCSSDGPSICALNNSRKINQRALKAFELLNIDTGEGDRIPANLFGPNETRSCLSCPIHNDKFDSFSFYACLPHSFLSLFMAGWQKKRTFLYFVCLFPIKYQYKHINLQVLRKGLIKAAKTTGAWIFTGGTNTGEQRI